MKQSEADKIVHRAIKDAAKRFGWRSKGGFLFTQKGLLFFTMIVMARAKPQSLSATLRYKLFDFDEAFWRVMGMEKNLDAPLSLHANGAFTAPSMEVDPALQTPKDWSEDSLAPALDSVLEQADARSVELAGRITTLDQNLAYLEGCLSELLKRSPRAAVDLHREKLLTAVLKKDFSGAKAIAEERLAQRDSGGFGVGTKSFYVLAKEFTERHLHPSG
jgi:hypothetical protein